MTIENWCMKVGDRIYGPYPTEKLRSFVTEKRLAYHSLVAPAGSRNFRSALQFAELRPLFGEREDTKQKIGSQVHLVLFGSRDVAIGAAHEVLSPMGVASPLTGTAYLLRSDTSAEDLRDALASALPNTERAIVITPKEATVASHGVSLAEHETLKRALSGASD